MPEWLIAQIKKAQKVRHNQVDVEKCLNKLEFTEANLKAWEDSEMV